MELTLYMRTLLEEEHTVAEVLQTFREYANSGASISLRSVKSVLEKYALSEKELEKAREILTDGILFHLREYITGDNENELKESKEYEKAVVYINNKLPESRRIQFFTE